MVAIYRADSLFTCVSGGTYEHALGLSINSEMCMGVIGG